VQFINRIKNKILLNKNQAFACILHKAKDNQQHQNSSSSMQTKIASSDYIVTKEKKKALKALNNRIQNILTNALHHWRLITKFAH
jgi:hypothetical protein